MEGQKHSLVLIRNWFDTPGWSTSWMAAAKMAARISKSVKTAWERGEKNMGRQLADWNQNVDLMISQEFDFNFFTSQWEKTCTREWNPDKTWYIILGLVLDFQGMFTNSLQQEDFTEITDHVSPLEQGWTGGCVWTVRRQQHAGCCGKPRLSGSGPPGSSCRSQKCPLGSWRFSSNLVPADHTASYKLVQAQMPHDYFWLSDYFYLGKIPKG